MWLVHSAFWALQESAWGWPMAETYSTAYYFNILVFSDILTVLMTFLHMMITYWLNVKKC
jgi:hypothetical protein